MAMFVVIDRYCLCLKARTHFDAIWYRLSIYATRALLVDLRRMEIWFGLDIIQSTTAIGQRRRKA